MDTNDRASQLKLMKRTWQALEALDLDPADGRCVARYEKLSKLWMALVKATAKKEPPADPKPEVLDF